MLTRTTRTFHTIIAQITPRGIGAVSIIRISGDKSKELFSLLTKKNSRQIKSKQIVSIYDFNCLTEQKKIDQALVLFFKSPQSFTGEDLLEIQMHGNPLIIKRTLDLCLSIEDVRIAEPGEFTQRAFFNNKLELTQAEAINDLIHARSEKLITLANKQLSGGFSSKIEEIIKTLEKNLIFLRGLLDFPVETEFFNQELDLSEIKESLRIILDKLKKLEKNYAKVEILRKGIITLIVGTPNVGKSSLLNLLLKQERAIVSKIAGTTRDFIQEEFLLRDLPIILIDTAGLLPENKLEESFVNPDNNLELEKLSIQKTWSKVKKAELILFVFDLAKNLDSEQEKLILNIRSKNPEAKFILVGNKLDLIKEQNLESNSRISRLNLTRVNLSVKENLQTEKLKDKIEELFGFADSKQEENLEFAINQRHYSCLRKAILSLEKTIRPESEDLLLEIFSFELESCISELKRISNKDFDTFDNSENEEIIGGIFQNFCIGK